jgi:hypothetical protein
MSVCYTILWVIYYLHINVTFYNYTAYCGVSRELYQNGICDHYYTLYICKIYYLHDIFELPYIYNIYIIVRTVHIISMMNGYHWRF